MFILFVSLQSKPLIKCMLVISEGQRFYPTSPLKDYTSPPGRRRRSQSANVRFKETSLEGDGVRNNRPASASFTFSILPLEGILGRST